MQNTSAFAVFTPTNGTIAASYEEDAAGSTPGYVIRQLSLKLSGLQDLTLEPNGGNAIPMPLIELAEGQGPWFTSLPNLKDPRGIGTIKVTATFRLDPALTDVVQAYIDQYGQAIKASWPTKVSKPKDLTDSVQAEVKWLQRNREPLNLDKYGGVKNTWTAVKSNGFYQVAQHNNRFFLVSPLGNPLFYLGVTSVDAYPTPVTPSSSRGQFFASLPSAAGLYASAYSAQGADFSFIVANQLRKYCTQDETNCTLPVPPPPPPQAACPASPCSLTNLSTDLETVRLTSWGFSGEGKFFSQMRLSNGPLRLPAFPVLEHDPSKVPPGFPSVKNLVLHPDPFDTKKTSCKIDPNTTLCQLVAVLESQMVPYKGDRSIVGWSMGNEKAEIIQSSEIESILQMGGTVPAKRSLVLHALNDIYGGDPQKLGNAWGIPPTEQQDLFDAVPKLPDLEKASGQPPVLDLENLREFYEDAYYSLFYNTVTQLDPNHLYFGSWILTGDSSLAQDWAIAAKYCDVIGFDDFLPGPLSSDLADLFASTGKPVLLGAWGVPSDYGGTRGFGWNSYTKAMTLSDSDSGDAYNKKLTSFAANPYVVGAMLFDYYDEPLTGRGGGSTKNDPDDALLGSADLEIGEDFAFGLLDTTDTPKYDFVNKVRAANCSVLETLALTRCP